jgi:NAD(P)-dependent dehydrogenase (short-subunit alcohol dehydrogenase family)
MGEQIVVVTGANSGIGKETALKFANAGDTVIMACRNLEKSKKVQDEIITASKNDNVFLMELDMSSFDSIKSFADEFKSKFSKLDILINNAAYFNHGEDYRLSADAIEITFATNVAGPFLLIHLLQNHLKKSDDARVLNASSNIIKHFFSPKKEIDFNNLQGITDSKYKHSVYTCYRNSKMAFLMLTFKMARDFTETGIKFYSLQINGARMSKETLKKFKPGWRFIARIQNLFFPPPEFMATNYFEICTSEKFKNETGIHLNHKLEIMQPGPEKPSIKHIKGTDYYPVYAENETIQNKIREFCRSVTNNNAN